MSPPQRHLDTRTAAAVPPEACYWAILDDRATPRPLLDTREKRHERLGYLFEEFLPVTIETVHAVYTRLPDQQTLACAMDRAHLNAIRAEQPELRTLTPASLPAHASAGVDLASLNLLTGEFEPVTVARARRLPAWVACAGVLALSAVLLTGMQRRIDVARDTSGELAHRTQSLYAHAFADLPPSSQPPAIRLVSELRTLRAAASAAPGASTAAAPRPSARAHDAALDLAHVLAAWPDRPGLRLESLSVTPDAAELVALAINTADAQHLAEALAGTVGWRADPPSVRRQRDDLRVVVRLRREAAP